jgi:hypothetical protein
MEMTPTVAMPARSFRFQLTPVARVEARPMLSLRPRLGMPMIVQPLR